MGVHGVLTRGSRWLIGNGESMDVCTDRWIPRTILFKVISPRPSYIIACKVRDLIDSANVCWNESLVRSLLLPCDADIVLNMPLYDVWPQDQLLWHYSSNGLFSVRSAYHVILGDRFMDGCGSSLVDNRIWRTIWNLEVPPRIRLFGWRVCWGILPTRSNIAG